MVSEISCIKGHKWCRQWCWHSSSTRDSKCGGVTKPQVISAHHSLPRRSFSLLPSINCWSRSNACRERILATRSVPAELGENEALCQLLLCIVGKRKFHFNAIIAVRSTFRPFLRFLVKSLTPQWIFRQINLTVHRWYHYLCTVCSDNSENHLYIVNFGPRRVEIGWRFWGNSGVLWSWIARFLGRQKCENSCTYNRQTLVTHIFFDLRTPL